MTIPVPHALQNPVELVYGSYAGTIGGQTLTQNYMIMDGGLGVDVVSATIQLSDGRVLIMEVHAGFLSVVLLPDSPTGDAIITTIIEDGVGGQLSFFTTIFLYASAKSFSSDILGGLARVRLDETTATKKGVVGGRARIEARISGAVGGRASVRASLSAEVSGSIPLQMLTLGVVGGQREIYLSVRGERQPAEMYVQALREDEELILLI